MGSVTVTKAVTDSEGLNRITAKNDKICFLLNSYKPLSIRRGKKVNITDKRFQKHITKLSQQRKVLVKEYEEPSTKVIRLPIELHNYFKSIGHGNIHKGLLRASFVCSVSRKNAHEAEKELIMHDVDKLMQHLKLLFPETHRNELHNLPAFVRMTLNGKCNLGVLKIEKEGDKSECK